MKKILTYQKNGGRVLLTYDLQNVTPIWHFRYKEDEEHLNSNALANEKKVIIGQPSALLRPIHSWSFLFTNPANFPVEDIRVKMTWWQDNNGQLVELEHWEATLEELKPNSGGQLKNEILMNPS